MKRQSLFIIIILTAVLLASCVPGPNLAAPVTEEIAGFWLGLWHGFISLFTFIISLFKEDVSIYEVVNNGGWYNFGFIIGVMIFWSGSGGGAAGSKCRKQ